MPEFMEGAIEGAERTIRAIARTHGVSEEKLKNKLIELWEG